MIIIVLDVGRNDFNVWPWYDIINVIFSNSFKMQRTYLINETTLSGQC